MHGTDSAGFEASYSRTAYLNTHQQLKSAVGNADAYDDARKINSEIAKEQAHLGAASNFKSTQAKLDNINPTDHKEAIDKLSSAVANEAGESAYKSHTGFQEKVRQGVANSDGSLKLGSKYQRGLNSQTEFDTGQNISNMENAKENIQKAIDEHKNKTQAEHNENYKGEANDFYRSELSSKKLAYAAGIAWKNPSTLLDLVSGDIESIHQKRNAQVKEDKAENERLDTALSQSTSALESAKNGDFGNAGALTGVQNYTIGTAGTTGTFNASGGFVQGGTQSGVSLSHNTQHSYSSGITASGGSLFAAGATQMGFSADGFAAGASALSAVTQTAALAAGPVGRGAMAMSSALGSSAGSISGGIVSKLNTMDKISRDFAHNQLSSIGHIGMEGDMMRFSSALSQSRALAQQRSQGASGMLKRSKKGLRISRDDGK